MYSTFFHWLLRTPMVLGAPPDSFSLLASTFLHATHTVGLGLLSPQLPATFCMVIVLISKVLLASLHQQLLPLDFSSLTLTFFFSFLVLLIATCGWMKRWEDICWALGVMHLSGSPEVWSQSCGPHSIYMFLHYCTQYIANFLHAVCSPALVFTLEVTPHGKGKCIPAFSCLISFFIADGLLSQLFSHALHLSSFFIRSSNFYFGLIQ